MKPLRVAILGGSFNPPTIAHMEMGNKILADQKADKLLFVPCGERPDKPELIEGSHRLNMLAIDIASSFRIAPRLVKSDRPAAFEVPQKILIDDYELRVYRKLMPTALLIQHFERRFPDVRFKFVMGSDLLETIRSWEFYDEVLRSREYLVFERDTHAISDFELPGRSEVLADPSLNNISSTKVRQLLAQREQRAGEIDPQMVQQLKQFINNDVLNYIVKNDLYLPRN